MEQDHITNKGLSSPYDKGREYLQQHQQPQPNYGPPPGLNLNHQQQQQLYHHLPNNKNGNQFPSGHHGGYYYPNMNSYNMIQHQQHQAMNPNDGGVFSYPSAVDMQNSSSYLFNNLSSSGSGSDINSGSGSSMQNNFYPTSAGMTAAPSISQSQYIYDNGNNEEFQMRKGTSSYLSTNAPTFIPLQHQQQQQQQQEYLFQQHNFDEQQKLVAKRTNSEPPMQKKNSTDDVNVIEPLIENIVGSISNTYTHFGNSGNVLKNLANNINNKNSTSSDNIAFILDQQQRINHIAIQQQQHGTNSSLVNNRSSTPKDFIENTSSNNSRPQTPKLSYLEVLTKNGSIKSSVTSTTTSNNDTPNPINNNSSSNNNNNSSSNSTTYRKSSSSSNFQEPSPTITTFASAVQFTNRKSGDLTQSSSSSNPSESSSPATKPKSYNNNTNQSFYHHHQQQQQQYKGNKENNSSNSNSKPSSGKNTPNSSTTPVHQIHYNNNKVINKGGSSSYLPGGGCNTDSEYVCNNGFSMVMKGGKGRKIQLPAQDQQIGATNHFEIEDFDENESLDSSKSSTSGVKSASKRKLLVNGKENSTSVDKERKNSDKSFSGGRKGGNSNVTKGEKYRNRRGQNCVLRKIQTITNFSFSYIKLHLISFVTWLWILVSDVTVLSCSLGLTLFGDFCTWWSSMLIPLCRVKLRTAKKQVSKLWEKVKGWTVYLKWKKKSPTKNEENQDGIGGLGGADRNYPDDEAAKLLSLLGPDKNIQLPSTGEEALKRLLSVKGQDPYSILGVRSNCSDETIRRYYKNQCRLVHPDKNCIVGAEEAFKILARAFDMIGEPLKRQEYNRQLFESKAKERVFGEIGNLNRFNYKGTLKFENGEDLIFTVNLKGNLLEQLRKKMESVTNTIRCTKCQKRHQKIRTDRQLYAARYCSQCRIFHSAREGDLWAEKKGFFGLSWHYYACMECSVWQINEWAKCQKKNLVHLKSDSHNVMYRLVAGAQNQQNQQNCGGEGGPEESLDNDDDWDSIINSGIINNIYTNNTNPTSSNKTTGGVKTQNGHVNNNATGGGVDGTRKRRGKRK